MMINPHNNEMPIDFRDDAERPNEDIVFPKHRSPKYEFHAETRRQKGRNGDGKFLNYCNFGAVRALEVRLVNTAMIE
jgi:hypothetical protein